MKRFFSIIGIILFYLITLSILLAVFAITMAYVSDSSLVSILKFIPLFLLSYFIAWFTCKIIYKKDSSYKNYICLVLAMLVVITCGYQEKHKIEPYLQPIKLTNLKFSHFQLAMENKFKHRIGPAFSATYKLLPLSRTDKDALDLMAELNWEANLWFSLMDPFKYKNFKDTCKNFKIEDIKEASCPSLLINDLLKNIRMTEATEIMVLAVNTGATVSYAKIIKDSLPKETAAVALIKIQNDMLELVVERALKMLHHPMEYGKYYYGFEAIEGSFITEFYKTVVKAISVVSLGKIPPLLNKAEETIKGSIEKNNLSVEQSKEQLERFYNIKRTWDDATKNINIEDMEHEIQKSKNALIVEYKKVYSISHLFMSGEDVSRLIDKIVTNNAATTSDKTAATENKLPNEAESYLKQGNAKAELKDYVGAIQDYDKAIELDPKNAEAYDTRGIVKSKLEDYKAAAADHAKAAELNLKKAEEYAKQSGDVGVSNSIKKAQDKLKKVQVQ